MSIKDLTYPQRHELELYILAELLIADIGERLSTPDNTMSLKEEGALLIAISETILSGRKFKLEYEKAANDHCDRR